MIKGIAHTAITVKNMDESLAFYVGGLGFQKAFSIPEPKTGEPWIEYIAVGGGQFIELFYGGTQDNPWNGKLIGFNHLCLEVDDIFETSKKVQDAGYAVTNGPKQGADGNWQAWVTDPNGIRIELMQLDPNSPKRQFYNK